MKQKHCAHQGHHKELLNELSLQRFDGTLDKVGPIVGGYNFNAVRKTALQFGQALFDGIDRLQRILAPAHDDDGANYFALTIKIRNAAAHLLPDPNLSNIR